MAFDKRYCRLQRFAGLGAVLDDHLLTLTLEHDVLVGLHVGRGPEHESDNQSDAYLTDNLVLAFQTFLVAVEDLDVVVHAAEEAQPHRSDEHQNQIDVAQTA